MNINTNYVNAHLVYQLELAGIRVLHNSFDIVVAGLASGEQVMIHLVERDIDVALIQATLEHNARARQSTLFMLWCPMLLPENGALYPPYDWMSALLELYDERIYAYENEGPQAWLFPVHFERKPGTLRRLVRYGEVVEMGNLRTEEITTRGHLSGRWRIADFGARTARHAHQDEQAEHIFTGTRHGLHVYYQILGVPLDADFERVRHAYRALARQFHPDLNASPRAKARMQEINAAYSLIVERLAEQGKL